MDKTRVKKREKIICRRLIPQAESWVYWHLPLLLSHTLSSYHALPLIPSILSTAVSRRHPGATGPSILTCKQIGLEPQDWPGASGSDLYVAPPLPLPCSAFQGTAFPRWGSDNGRCWRKSFGELGRGEAWLFLSIPLCRNSNCMSPAWLHSSSVILLLPVPFAPGLQHDLFPLSLQPRGRSSVQVASVYLLWLLSSSVTYTTCAFSPLNHLVTKT